MKTFLTGLLLLCVNTLASAGMTFNHPGALNSRAELDFMKAQVNSGAKPWKSEFEQLKATRPESRVPRPFVHINSRKDDEASVSQQSATAAYALALLWYITEDERYAQKAVTLLNSFSTLESFTAGDDQDKLHAGWLGATLAPAAEIMRAYPKWSPAEISALQAAFRKSFYPQLNTASRWNGNVDLTQIDAMASIAVFNEDETEFNLALERLRARSPAYFYLASDGPLPKSIEGDHGDPGKFWFHPRKWVDGLMQETCRDNGHHAQFGLGSALHAAETAWLQGVDVYSEFGDRYAAAMELLASQFLAGSMLGVNDDDKPTANRFGAWTVGYRHYNGRKGIALPNTRRLIAEQIIPHGDQASCNLNFETLTHAEPAVATTK